MNHSFSVNAANTQIKVTAEAGKPRTGTASFVISNKTGHELKGGIEIEPLGETKKEWFTPVFVVGNKEFAGERMFAAGETCTAQVRIAIPATTPPANYQFRLNAYSVDEKEEDYTRGQDVQLKIDQASQKPPRPFPWWILAVVGGVAVVATVVLVVIFTRPKLVVPNVESIPYKSAVDTLTQRGLIASLASDILPKDTNTWIVETQDPEAGKKVKKNADVALTIAAAVVPKIVGKTEAVGSKSLDSAGFVAVKAGERDGEGALGTIVAQSPPPDEVAAKGAKVNYWLKANATTPTIPGQDCIGFNNSRLQLRQEGTQFLLTDGSSRMKMFPNRAEAETALRIIRTYGFNSQCFVGRPDPSMEYMLVNGKPPQGAITGEDCLSFNPNNLTVRQSGALYLLVDGSHSLKAFPNRQEAELARSIIQAHKFTSSCFVGRPDPSMTYFRK